MEHNGTTDAVARMATLDDDVRTLAALVEKLEACRRSPASGDAARNGLIHATVRGGDEHDGNAFTRREQNLLTRAREHLAAVTAGREWARPRGLHEVHSPGGTAAVNGAKDDWADCRVRLQSEMSGFDTATPAPLSPPTESVLTGVLRRENASLIAKIRRLEEEAKRFDDKTAWGEEHFVRRVKALEIQCAEAIAEKARLETQCVEIMTEKRRLEAERDDAIAAKRLVEAECAHITVEKDHLATKCTDIMAEKRRLEAERDEVIAAKRLLETESASTNTEKDRLAIQYADAITEKRRLEVERDEAVAAKRLLEIECASITTEKNHLEAHYTDAITEKHRIEIERDEAVVARSSLQINYAAAVEEKTRLGVQYAEAVAEKTRLEAECAEAVAEKDRIETQCAQAVAENDQLKRQHADTFANQGLLKTHNAQSIAEKARLEAACVEATTEKNRLEREIADAVAAKERLTVEFTEVVSDNNRLERQLADEIAEKEHVVLECATERAVADELRATIAYLQSQLNDAERVLCEAKEAAAAMETQLTRVKRSDTMETSGTDSDDSEAPSRLSLRVLALKDEGELRPEIDAESARTGRLRTRSGDSFASHGSDASSARRRSAVRGRISMCSSTDSRKSQPSNPFDPAHPCSRSRCAQLNQLASPSKSETFRHPRRASFQVGSPAPSCASIDDASETPGRSRPSSARVSSHQPNEPRPRWRW